MVPELRRSLLVRVERVLIGGLMSTIAFVLERRLLKAKHREPGA